MSGPTCFACGGEMEFFDTIVVLGKYDATYHRCPGCGLVAALDTPWLEEAYASPIHDADAGLLRRARRYSAVASAVIRFEKLSGRMLDWAGGYGVLAQAMRDRGHDFWHHDAYAEPVFARDYRDEGEGKLGLVTAFEVLEHLADPKKELADIAARTDYFLFTTELVPEPAPKLDAWWYYWPEVGQHISLHTVESLRHVGEALGFQLTSNGRNWHLFHRAPLDPRTKLLFSATLNKRARAVRDSIHHARLRLRNR